MGRLRNTTCALLLLLLFLVAAPYCFSEDAASGSPAVYDIDYRGPETHTTIPPPKRGGRRRNIIHHQQTMVARHKRPIAVVSASTHRDTHGRNGKKYHK